MNDEPKVAMREAAHSLYELFRCGDGMHPYIAAIGEGAHSIHVYLVRKPRGHERQIPSEHQGWPIVTRVTGRMKPC